MFRKYLLVLPVTAVFTLMGCHADPPPAPTVVPPTVTKTVTVTPPTKTVVESKDCVDKGISTAGWNTAKDTPSMDELKLEQPDPDARPMVDAPLIDIRAWQGQCFDSIEFVFDTRVNNPEDGDRPWFSVEYVPVVTQDGSGHTIVLNGAADMRVVIFAPADSWRYGEPDRPVTPIEASDYRREMDYNFGAIHEVQGAGDYEGIVTFGIGVNEVRPFAAEYNDNSDGTTSVVVRIYNR